jgi:hypothetical protein
MRRPTAYAAEPLSERTIIGETKNMEKVIIILNQQA